MNKVIQSNILIFYCLKYLNETRNLGLRHYSLNKFLLMNKLNLPF